MDYFPVLKDSQPSNKPLVSIRASNKTYSQPEQEAKNSHDMSVVENNSRISTPNQELVTELIDDYKPFSNFSKPTNSDERARGNSDSLHSMPSYEIQQIRKTGRNEQKPPPKVAPKPKRCKSPKSRCEGSEKMNASSMNTSKNDRDQKIPIVSILFSFSILVTLKVSFETQTDML